MPTFLGLYLELTDSCTELTDFNADFILVSRRPVANMFDICLVTQSQT